MQGRKIYRIFFLNILNKLNISVSIFSPAHVQYLETHVHVPAHSNAMAMSFATVIEATLANAVNNVHLATLETQCHHVDAHLHHHHKQLTAILKEQNKFFQMVNASVNRMLRAAIVINVVHKLST